MIDIPSPIQFILTALRSRDYEAFPVGGCVRDSLRGVTPADWDICTSAKPQDTIDCFPAGTAIPTGIKHGTVTVCVGNTTSEVTTYRTDGVYSDARRPDSVTFVTSLEDDLRRRDFTVNAMALDASGAVIDPFGGQADLQSRIIRCVGDPDERFQEDALRILRAMRFASRLDYTIDRDTGAAMLRNRALLQKLSAERVWKELGGILTGSGCGSVLSEYGAVLSVILPELNPELISRRGAALAAAPKDRCLRLALLLRGQDTQTCAEMLDRLRCDKASRNRTLNLINALHSPLPQTREEQLHQAQMLGWTDTLLVAGLRDQKCAAELRTLREAHPCLTVRDLSVDGNDILRLGAPTGEIVGLVLRILLNCVWNGEAENTRESLIPVARELLRSGSAADMKRAAEAKRFLANMLASKQHRGKLPGGRKIGG